jgi:hypothetical protein
MPMQAQGAGGPTTLRPLYPRERSGTLCIGGWVGFGAGLGSTENLAAAEIRFPENKVLQRFDETIMHIYLLNC